MRVESRSRTGLLWLWLTLAIVLTHALVPTGSPLARQPGSAFSMSTTDVALGPGRRAPPGKARKAVGAPAVEDKLDDRIAWADQPEPSLPAPHSEVDPSARPAAPAAALAGERPPHRHRPAFLARGPPHA